MRIVVRRCNEYRYLAGALCLDICGLPTALIRSTSRGECTVRRSAPVAAAVPSAIIVRWRPFGSCGTLGNCRHLLSRQYFFELELSSAVPRLHSKAAPLRGLSAGYRDLRGETGDWSPLHRWPAREWSSGHHPYPPRGALTFEHVVEGYRAPRSKRARSTTALSRRKGATVLILSLSSRWDAERGPMFRRSATSAVPMR